MQEGHGGNTCSDLFRDLAPYLRENRSLRSTSSTPKWLSARQGAQGTRRPAEPTARRRQLCPEDEDALMQLLRKKTEQLEELEDKVYEERFRAIFSSLEDKEGPMTSSCVRRDPSSPTLEPAAGPSVPHSTCSVTKDAAGETESSSELVSLDQLLADLCPVSDDSLSCNALVKGLLEKREEEQLPDREAAGERDREPERALSLQPQDKKEEPVASALDSYPWDERKSQPPPTSQPEETSGFPASPSSGGSCEERATRKPPQQAEHDKLLCMGTEDVLKDLLQIQTQQLEEEDDDQTHGDLFGDILSFLDKESHPCDEGHSEPLPTALPQDTKMFAVCASPAEPVDEADGTRMEARHAQATPPQEKPCRAGAPAGACPVPAQPLPQSVTASPPGSAAVTQPPAPRRWRSIVKTARRALRRLFSFCCRSTQLEE